MINCIIIDDEELARLLLQSYVEKTPFLELKGVYENPVEALTALKDSDIDVIFLDIQMPEIKGTDFAKLIPNGTRFIFTTAYSEFALEGYSLNALDYLLKPITYERFLEAASKLQQETVNTISDQSLTIKSGYDLHKIKLNDIVYIESDSEYVNFYISNGKKIMSYQSLKSLEKTLPNEIFMRVHRSYIINKNMVTSLKGKDLVLNGKSIPVSTTYYDNVKETLFS